MCWLRELFNIMISGLKRSILRSSLQHRRGRFGGVNMNINKYFNRIHLGESGRGSSSHLSNTEVAKLDLELIELLEQFRLLFCAELVDVEFGYMVNFSMNIKGIGKCEGEVGRVNIGNLGTKSDVKLS